ncbi:MAG TPA: glycoside hydrolase family 38 C-terminal domain-containing protein [Candidatus Dormibacteraeota bacterium]|nr:glycoside hydrolase family 38 C-terminal domain-containing protein [Candidatus Dormibacteraeota bacterium]
MELTALLVRGEPIPFAEAVRGDFQPFRVGDPWGPAWSTTWFHVRGQVPPELAGRRAAVAIDLGWHLPTGFSCEALAWRDGKPWRGVDPNHHLLPVEGPEFDFYLEAAANPMPTLAGAEPAVSMIELRESPDLLFRLNQLEVVPWPPPVAGDARVDLGVHAVTAVGHAHIDTAWLWPLREARRKCARSWSTQLELMDQHPDFVFACSQPAQYEWVKQSYPDLYRRIEDKVATGQWEPVGAMWVEADCNLPSGEALVRQLLHGKRYFMQEFGCETRILWLPDVFGYPGNLPQLIKESGCDYFLTQKLSWNDTNKPEHHTFWWEGIDGTRVFTHFPPADTYNGDFSTEQVESSARNFKDAASSNRSLYLFGYGDGGGGPTAEMIESAQSLDVPMGRAIDFFDRASAEAHDLATVRGELYFELHRGTYTSQGRTKWWNRRAQTLLREAEMWSVAAGGAYPRAELEALWKTLLLNQFHDILPGSSIDWVYEEAERDLEAVSRRAEALAFEAGAVARPPLDGDGSLENEHLRVELGADGVVTSIWDKEAGREGLSGPGNVLELHDDNPRKWDAWDVDIEHRDSFSVVGRRFGASTVTQRISLHGRVLRFATDVEWRERHKMLKVAFPISVSASEATYEVQFGHVRRPTHMNTPEARAMFEVCAQRWADLGDGNYGVALLNDSKHGYDIHDSVMRLSLLRAPTHPDPNADQGLHRFTYALMPHQGDFRNAGVIEAAEELNSVFGPPPGLLSLDTTQVRVEAIKRAEDSDAVIVRLYEAWGRPCRARITTTVPARRVTLCDLLEREREETSLELDFRPFQVVTLKLEG